MERKCLTTVASKAFHPDDPSYRLPDVHNLCNRIATHIVIDGFGKKHYVCKKHASYWDRTAKRVGLKMSKEIKGRKL